MLLRQNPVLKLDIEKKLSQIGTELKLDAFETTALGQFLLLHAQLSETLEGFKVFEKENLYVFCFAIATENLTPENLTHIANNLIDFYSSTPDLKAKNITAEEHKNPESSFPKEIKQLPTIIIQMRKEDFNQHLLPAFKLFLQNHPHFIAAHQRSNYPFAKMKKAYTTLLSPTGIYLEESNHALGALICLTIENLYHQREKMGEILSHLLPVAVMTLAQDYVSPKVRLTANKVTSSNPTYQPGRDDFTTSFLLQQRDTQTAAITLFFNSLMPNSAKSDDQYDYSSLVRVDVSNQCLNHPFLHAEMKLTLTNTPFPTLDNFRKESKTTTVEKCVKTLHAFLQELAEYSAYKKLEKELKDLIDYINQNPVPEVKNINAKLETVKQEYKKFMDAEAAKLKYANSNRQCIHKFYSAKLMPDQLVKKLQSIEKALDELDKIFNQKFAPPAKRNNP